MRDDFDSPPGECFECKTIIQYLERAISIYEEKQDCETPSKEVYRFSVVIHENCVKIKRYHKKCFLENIAGEDFWD